MLIIVLLSALEGDCTGSRGSVALTHRMLLAMTMSRHVHPAEREAGPTQCRLVVFMEVVRIPQQPADAPNSQYCHVHAGYFLRIMFQAALAKQRKTVPS